MENEYPDLAAALIRIHSLPSGATGGERNHKSGKRVHCKSRVRMSQQKVEAQTAICFNGAQLERAEFTTRDRVTEPFLLRLSTLNIESVGNEVVAEQECHQNFDDETLFLEQDLPEFLAVEGIACEDLDRVVFDQVEAADEILEAIVVT